MPALVPRVSRWEWLQAALLAGNLVATTLALGGYLRETLLWSCAVTCVIVALKLARAAFASSVSAQPRWHPAGWWLVPFLAYAGANALWVSPVGWLGWRDWLGWAQGVATFWLALDAMKTAGPRRMLWATLLGLGGLLVALGSYQRWVDPQWLMLGRTQSRYFAGRASGAFGIPNSMAAFLVLLIPATLAVAWGREFSARTRAGAGMLAGLFLCGLVMTVSRGPWLALAVALVAWPLLNRALPWRRRWARAGLALAGAAVLVGALYIAAPGVRARIDGMVADRGEKTRPIIWHAAWSLWRESPWLGTGAGSFGVAFEKHRPEGFWDDPQWAHNDYLNTLSDYGVVGFVLGFGGMACIGARAVRASRGRVAGEAPVAALGVGLGAFGLALCVDFHLKLPALAMAVAWIAAEAVGATWPKPAAVSPTRSSARARVSSGVLAVMALMLAGGKLWPQSRAEAVRGEARRKIDQLAVRPVPADAELVRLTHVRAKLREAVAADGGNAQAWADLAYAGVLIGRLDPAQTATCAREAESAARRALALTRVVPEFWWRLGVALDMQGRWTEGGEAFARGVTLAAQLPQAWFYTAYHFSLRASARPLAQTAIATCLRLDPWFSGAKVLQEQLNSQR